MRGINTICLMLLVFDVNAGAWAPTAHSRANCGGFNESITWHLGHSYWWRVESHHFPAGWSKPAHILDTGKAYVWRAAAYHSNEAYSSRGDKWWVNGFHFWYPNGSGGREKLDVMTSASDCNIYDGWWDQ
ncbi:hypothetical protein [Legionella sp. 28fT52]|uniref:hypothetical protein n=1 Tax=Legionella sp. 28fT52 TaxID=3410134 RepID=UPI003AF66489